MTFTRGLAAMGLIILSASSQAMATEQLTLPTDQTQLLDIGGTPSTVVVGNPSIADVTIQGKHVFLHGRAFGITNIILLDQNGKRMSDFEVSVVRGAQNDVRVFKAGDRFSLVCAPDCESTIHIGDRLTWFTELSTEIGIKSGLATGKETSEANEPKPPAQ